MLSCLFTSLSVFFLLSSFLLCCFSYSFYIFFYPFFFSFFLLFYFIAIFASRSFLFPSPSVSIIYIHRSYLLILFFISLKVFLTYLLLFHCILFHSNTFLSVFILFVTSYSLSFKNIPFPFIFLVLSFFLLLFSSIFLLFLPSWSFVFVLFYLFFFLYNFTFPFFFLLSILRCFFASLFLVYSLLSSHFFYYFFKFFSRITNSNFPSDILSSSFCFLSLHSLDYSSSLSTSNRSSWSNYRPIISP